MYLKLSYINQVFSVYLVFIDKFIYTLVLRYLSLYGLMHTSKQQRTLALRLKVTSMIIAILAVTFIIVHEIAYRINK